MCSRYSLYPKFSKGSYHVEDEAYCQIAAYCSEADLRSSGLQPYIAGETVPDAVNTVRRLNGLGAVCTVDVLGEFVSSRSQAEQRSTDVPNSAGCYQCKSVAIRLVGETDPRLVWILTMNFAILMYGTLSQRHKQSSALYGLIWKIRRHRQNDCALIIVVFVPMASTIQVL